MGKKTKQGSGIFYFGMLCTDDDLARGHRSPSLSRTWDTCARARPDLREKAMAGHGGRVVLVATLGEQEKMPKRATTSVAEMMPR